MDLFLIVFLAVLSAFVVWALRGLIVAAVVLVFVVVWAVLSFVFGVLGVWFGWLWSALVWVTKPLHRPVWRIFRMVAGV